MSAVFKGCAHAQQSKGAAAGLPKSGAHPIVVLNGAVDRGKPVQ